MINNIMPLVSIIVPVFNVEAYLKQCIDSIICQSLKEIEIILVDDGSTDSSGLICDEYALIDSRIHVIHHDINKGLSCSRNDGIDISVSPYIMFVDGDDWVDSQFCELPYQTALENDADLVLFSYKRFYADGKEDLICTKIKSGPIDEAQALAFNVMIWDAAWIGFYRRELFNEIRYPVGKLYEDTGTSHRLIHTAKRLFLLDECVYHYRVGRIGSITTNPTTRDHPDRIEMRICRIKDLCNWGEYEWLAMRDALVLLERYGQRLEEYEYLSNLIKSGKDTKQYLKWQQRVMQTIFKISTVLFDVICLLTRRRIKK